jgi:hypothetical protein
MQCDASPERRLVVEWPDATVVWPFTLRVEEEARQNTSTVRAESNGLFLVQRPTLQRR